MFKNNTIENSSRFLPKYVNQIGLLTVLICVILFSTACATVTVGPTPTPTRTPKPTLTPTPVATNTPSPTPTPAYPVSVGCTLDVPQPACETLQTYVAQFPQYFTWAEPDILARIRLTTKEIPGAIKAGQWVYGLSAPFYTVDDSASLDDVHNTWMGTASGALEAHPLLMSQDTQDAFSALWGPPHGEAVRIVEAGTLLTSSLELQGWSLIPFEALHPQWKIIEIDGYSPVDPIGESGTTPLSIPLYLSSDDRPDAMSIITDAELKFSNRNSEQMTRVMMTGVTAMTRATGLLMDSKGITYPAISIKSWFNDADFVHISNEVSFTPNCIAEGSGTMSFCSNDVYIALLEEINTNIVELTGNHLEDKGNQWVDHSLDMYAQRGWKWYGGGANQVAATLPITLTHNGNKIAFLGCNTVGPYAGEDSGGAASCGDWDLMTSTLADLHAQGYQTIFTVQYLEDYDYSPTAPQMRDFRNLAESGAVYVQGSQAHQAQTMEFHENSFIHYGLGNFFFDQMWSDGTRQEFVNQLTFYNGQLINIELKTAIMEEYGRPRPMTIGDPAPEADRAQFLEMIFSLSPDR